MIYYTECGTCNGRGYFSECRVCDMEVDQCLCGIDFSRTIDITCQVCDGEGMVRSAEETAHGYKEEQDEEE